MLSEEELEADLRCQGAREGRERGQRSRAGQDERSRQTSWAGLGDLLGDLLRGLLVGNSHCWWRAQMQLLLLHQMVPRAPITVHWFHWTGSELGIGLGGSQGEDNPVGLW